MKQNNLNLTKQILNKKFKKENSSYLKLFKFFLILRIRPYISDPDPDPQQCPLAHIENKKYCIRKGSVISGMHRTFGLFSGIQLSIDI